MGMILKTEIKIKKYYLITVGFPSLIARGICGLVKTIPIGVSKF